MDNHMVIKKTAVSLLTAAALFAQSQTYADPVTIASLDYGASVAGPPARAERVTGGWDFVNNDDTPEDNSGTRHGTVIANLLLENSPGDTIVMPLKVAEDGNDFPKSRGNAAYRYILDRPEVRVIDHTYSQAVDIPLMQQAVDTGRVIVIQAGNEGKENPQLMAQKVPQLKGGGVVVGGIIGGEVGFSNKAGNLKDYFIVAPVSNRYTDQKGTSFAKPHVSATAATMLARDPHLTPQQVVRILFDTADDLGDPGVDDVYGHGKLNRTKALEPVGESSVGGGSSSSGAGIAIAALAVGGAVAYVLSRKSESLKKTLILDSYGRSFHLDLTSRITARDDSARMRSLIKGYTSLQKTAVIENNLERTAYAVMSTPNTRAYDDRLLTDPFADDADRIKDFVYSYYSFDRDGGDYHYALNGSLNRDFGAGREALAGFNFSSGNVFSTPYLGFSNQGMGLSFGKSYADSGVQTRLGLTSYDDQGLYGAESDSVLFETQVEKGRGAVGMQAGYLMENGSLFGGASNGAFSADYASTLSIGLSASYKLSNRLTLIGNYSEGLTSVDDANNGLLSNFSSLRSNSKSIGLLANSVFQYKDRLGIAVYQPLSISQGSVDLTVPDHRDLAGNIYSNRERLDLSNDGDPETRFELYYGKNLSRKTAIHAHLVHKEGAYLEREGRQSVLAAITHEF
ncbi:MAG: S8 family serine peptidase [Pseudomonadota bacterium]|nr:S8 family serine peptidase [Pseudomonadota bacterium]